MPEVGFEPTIPVLERAKTVHVLDSAATATVPILKTKGCSMRYLPSHDHGAAY
jgi:hypothetical protein